MKKVCTVCKKMKETSLFPYKNKTKGILHSQCKVCLKKQTNEHYYKNKAYYFKKNNERRDRVAAENKSKLLEYLREHPCVDCGLDDIVVLQFDHVRGKKRNLVPKMASSGCAWKTIQLEIEKCEIRCANCHIRRTFKQLGWYDKQ